MENTDKIELRSEKVRNIIGNVPPGIIRSGTGIITIILLGLLLIAFYIPYPENISTKATITNIDQKNYYAIAYIPYHYITEIKIDMPIQLELEGYSSKEYGFQKGIINFIDNEIIVIDDHNFFCIYLRIPKTEDISIIQENMNCIASILISNKSIIRHLSGK